MFALHPRPFAFSFAGAAVFAVATVVSGFAIRWVIDSVILPRFEDGEVATSAVVTGVVMIIGIGLVRAVGVVFRRAFASAGMWQVAQSYTNQVLDRLVAQPVSWHRRRADGDLIARAGVDTEAAVSVIAPIPFATSTVLMVVVSTIWLFVTDVPLGIVAVIVFPLVIATNVIYERSVSDHYTRAQAQLGDFSAGVHESFEAVQLVKAYGAESRETARLTELANRVKESRVLAIERRSWFDALTDIIPSLANIVLVLLGAVRVDSGDVTVGEFSSAIFLFTLLVFPLRLIVTEPLTADPASKIELAGPGVGISLDGVSFAHDGAMTSTLSDVSLSLDAGSITALVGPTGSGKSTVADLVVGLTLPTSGTVRLAAGKRAIVFQEAFLVAGTVRENIAFGSEVTDDDVWAAARMAAADDFIAALPDGLDTIVGERGVSLSGGQRQRVALARALVRRPSVLVLDDTTSALDPTTEGVILERLRTTLDSTVLLIASRPSTIALADAVVFMSDGRIVAHGTHEELFENERGYREIVEAFESDRAETS
jgi:ATP-binding cassette, subfamily B, bacterial